MPAIPKETLTPFSLTEKRITKLNLKDHIPMSANTDNSSTTEETIVTENKFQQSQKHIIESLGCRAPSVNSINEDCIAEEIANKGQLSIATSKINIADTEVCNTVTALAADHKFSIVSPPKKTANDFIFGKYIGEGSFSMVYLAIDVKTKREYAIKVCEKRHILREQKQEYIRREREIMHIMSNVSGFVNLSCTFQDHRSLYFVMTYAKNGDLLPYINKVGSFDVNCTRHYAAELVLACEQMHRRHVVHRDLKPENILLDEKMHTLIADFGSAKILGSDEASTSHNNDESIKNSNDTNSAEVESPTRFHFQKDSVCKRKGSFVGTAQYVSPEVLQNAPITPGVDLWALGCIVYQMIAGLPPFRGSNDYAIFKEILACNLEFPEGFNKNAEDLVRRLMHIDPMKRLGAQDCKEQYESIRIHPFFEGIDFDTVRDQTPPAIYPYLPDVPKDGGFHSKYRVPENLEPGLNDQQLTRLLEIELGTSTRQANSGNDIAVKEQPESKNVLCMSAMEKRHRLEQQKSDKWHVFADHELILKKGYINKRKGLFTRKRMLLLTTGPRLIYIDPVQMIKKGEIPWSHELRVEAKNFKLFFVHTPNRTYYLEEPEGYSLHWVNAIENMWMLTYSNITPAARNNISAVAKTSSTNSCCGLTPT